MQFTGVVQLMADVTATAEAGRSRVNAASSSGLQSLRCVTPNTAVCPWRAVSAVAFRRAATATLRLEASREQR